MLLFLFTVVLEARGRVEKIPDLYGVSYDRFAYLVALRPLWWSMVCVLSTTTNIHVNKANLVGICVLSILRR